MNFEISRRNFFKWAAFLTAGLALPKALKAKVIQPKEKPLPRLEKEVYKPAVCKMCPAMCMLQIRLVNEKPVGVSGMPNHPICQGAFCPKGGAILQDLYHPDRLRGPLRLLGSRGSNKWEKITWDEAHQIIQEKLSWLLKNGHPENLGILAAPIKDIRHEIQKRFAQAFGTPNFWEWNWALAEPPLDAFNLMHGLSCEGLFYDLMNANLVVSFGWDWLQAHPSPVEAQRAFSELRRARFERRTRVIQIEPRLSTTAAKAALWISIKPDTEGYLALGVAHVILLEDLHNQEFIHQWGSGFEDYKKLVLNDYSLDKVSNISGVHPHQIVELAHEMASIKPAIAITYRGSQFNQLAVHSLNALLGSIGVRRGVLSSEAERYKLILPPSEIPQPKSSSLAQSPHEIPEKLLAGAQSPIQVFWMERVNPVFLSPQPQAWKQALEKIPFVVSFSSYLDESSQMADLVLPPHHSLEAWQYGFTMSLEGKGVVSFAPPVIEPFYETGDHGDFILRLAHSLDNQIKAVLPWTSFVESLLVAARKAQVEEVMKKGGWWEYKAVKKDFGKLRFPASELQPQEKENQTMTPDALGLYVYVPLGYSFGEGGHLPYLHSLAGAQLGEQWETWAEIHPITAKKLGFVDGQKIWVESSLGKIQARLRLYDGVKKDVVCLPFGMGHTALGRYAQRIGTNPAELVERKIEKTGQTLWQKTQVKIYAA